MRIENVSKYFGDSDRLISLYERSFPENERHPNHLILEGIDGHMETYAFYDGGVFCGFATLLTCKDISHIVYFAIEESLRSRGYGSSALQAMHLARSGFRIIVDIERITPDCQNPDQRARRKQFYLRNGYHETEVRYRWRGDDYEMLVFGGGLTETEFRDFWDTLEFVI